MKEHLKVIFLTFFLHPEHTTNYHTIPSLLPMSKAKPTCQITIINSKNGNDTSLRLIQAISKGHFLDSAGSPIYFTELK